MNITSDPTVTITDIKARAFDLLSVGVWDSTKLAELETTAAKLFLSEGYIVVEVSKSADSGLSSVIVAGGTATQQYRAARAMFASLDLQMGDAEWTVTRPWGQAALFGEAR